MSDIVRMSNVFTYNNIENNLFTCIGHIACSEVVDSVIIRCEILINYVTSDHEPMIVEFSGLLSNYNITIVNNIRQCSNDRMCIIGYLSIIHT